MTRHRHPLRTPDGSFDQYCAALEHGGPWGMGLKRWRIVSATILNLLVSGLAAFAMLSGADPTLVAAAALLVLGGLNGMEYHEWIAAQQALAEMGDDEGEE